MRAEFYRKGEGHLGDAWSKSMGKVDTRVLSGVVERDVRVGGWITYTPARWLRIEGRAGESELKNRDHFVSGEWNSEAPVSVHTSVAW